jgi:hypothetical protein
MTVIDVCTYEKYHLTFSMKHVGRTFQLSMTEFSIALSTKKDQKGKPLFHRSSYWYTKKGPFIYQTPPSILSKDTNSTTDKP